jgi:bla regulator protein BlaR1
MMRFFEIVLANLAVASLLAGIAWSAGRWLKRPALAHGLWTLVLVKLITPPLVGVPVLFPAVEPLPSEAPLPIAVLVRDAADRGDEFADFAWDFGAFPFEEVQQERLATEEAVAPLPPIQPISAPAPEPIVRTDWTKVLLFTVGTVWVVGSVSWFLAAWIRLRRFARCVRFGTLADADLQGRVDGLARGIGVASPAVVLLRGVVSPMLWVRGFAPCLILPAELLPRLEGQQGDALLLHELAHWKRGDHWVRRLEMVVLGIYWWCPLAWWAKARIEDCEEECCDAWVVSTLPGAARDYALALVETLDFLAGTCPALPPTASGLGRLTSLQRRLTMIVRGPLPRALTVGGAVALLGVGALLLPLAPSRAQAPEVQKQIEKALVELAQDENPPRRKDGDRPKEGPRDGDQPKKGPRDGDQPKKGPRDGDQPKKGPRDGDKPKEGDKQKEPGKDGERPNPQKGELRELMMQLQQLEADAERARAEAERKMRMMMELRRRVMELQQGGDRKEFRPPVGNPGGPDTERRLSELERKMDMILQALRRDGGPQPPMPPLPPMPPRSDRKDGPAPPQRKEGGPRREGGFDIELEFKRP